MKIRHTLSILCIALCALFILQKNYSSNSDANAPSNFDKGIYQGSQTFAEVLHLFNSKCYQKPDSEKAMNDAITAFSKTADPHSAFMDSKSYKSILETTQGEFYGIGIHIDNFKDVDDEFLRVIDIIPAGPADKAGIKPDDKIVQINGESLRGMALDEAIAKIKGKRNTLVELDVLRANASEQVLHFSINRDIVKEQNALGYYMPEHNIYYLSLNMFTENSVSQVEQLLKQCHKQECKGLILDLRNNSGGLLNAVIDISGLFLEKGSVVVITKDRSDGVEKYATTKSPIANRRIPIFIIVNNFTASAAEILAGCLQLYSQKQPNLQVFIVGCKTYGKGSVQEVIPLSNDCALRLTIAVYAFENGTLIQGEGVTPDFEIDPKFPAPKEVTWFNKCFGREANLKNAIKVNEKKSAEPSKLLQKEPEKTWQERKRELIGSDYMIVSTVRLIEMLDLLKRAYPAKMKNRETLLASLKDMYNPKDLIALEELKNLQEK